MVTRKIAIVGGILAGLVSAVASADMYNVRPVGDAMTLSTLNGLLISTNLSPAIDVVSDQSGAAIWQRAETDSAAYLVSLVSGVGKLGIYSYSNGSEYSLNVGSAADTATFKVNTAGTLSINNATIAAGFGSLFGFYFEDALGSKVYTEDSKNAGNSNALTYQLASGSTIDIVDGAGTDMASFSGNNDWILAFENTGDAKFNDGLFAIEDIKVPEPASIALMALGLLGVTMVARRRSNKGVALQFA